MSTPEPPRKQQHIGDIAGYWAENIDSIVQTGTWSDGSPESEYTLSDEDKRIILESLKRQFIAQKRDRTQVLHAYKAIAGQQRPASPLPS
ncbi:MULTISPECIES: hypothetical protein [unclassified Cryobacterium]|uniref:hypothetical protein n=1 Tax=unclassified Cryobacterium TaxID=2649013 RepID=UPI001069E36E|nr:MULTISPECIES: hypothetical protein [unclassified Cryobacterium]TFC59425.1 hypothetical protein E3O68_00555 [Cryobacterium sp. TMB3-1-2]TFC67221.1 hypothetical protein E3T21_17250 [Cryobacterium sp. TMB3-15]TFC73266.1 hypothetical protein E3T22_16805 [Cryobacterium sp. TMB3-10]TFD46154.1 hypothetical protein E3T58_01440 [Cryobacterium sp. TMB3-12]